MSAFVVEDKVINRIVGYLSYKAYGYAHYAPLDILRNEQNIDLNIEADQSVLGQMMFELNCNAIEQRYGTGEAKEFRDLDYGYHLESTDIIQAYKSLRCWLYQCSEGDVPESSLLYATMERVAGSLAEEIVSDLPDYEKAEW